MLDAKQRSVVAHAVSGFAAAVLLMAAAISHNFMGWQADISIDQRLLLIARFIMIPALFLAICIGRLANHRFFSATDIDGSPLTAESPRAIALQKILQNTLEQSLLAMCAYVSWGMLAPGNWLSVIPVAALLFALGRLLFIAKHHQGATGRALGFALTFYPTMLILLGATALAIF